MPKNSKKKPKEPPKPWSIDTSAINEKHLSNLTDSERQNYHNFANNVASGQHPKTAAVGDMNYKKLGGSTKNQYEIRLSQGNRATFTVDNKNKKVHVLDVGGHT